MPTAEFVFCLDPLPSGWTYESVAIDQDGTVIFIDSDRAGDDAAVLHYEQSCDPGSAVPTPSDHVGVERLVNVESLTPGFAGQIFSVFEGGCIWWDFSFASAESAGLAIGVEQSLVLWTRDDFSEQLRSTFIDEEI